MRSKLLQMCESVSYRYYMQALVGQSMLPPPPPSPRFIPYTSEFTLAFMYLFGLGTSLGTSLGNSLKTPGGLQIQADITHGVNAFSP